jgi:hypothetical protein
MTFDDWWEQLPTAEQKLIGINNARFVWQEAQKNQIHIMALPNFTMSRMRDKIAIMSHHGEGGTFDINEFDKAVSQFFAEKF